MDHLRSALDRSVGKEMAVDALRQSNARDALSREEWDRLVSPTYREATTEQGFDNGTVNFCEDSTGDDRAAGEEIEFELNS